MDWDSAYRGEAVFEGPPPVNIGELQPELATPIDSGAISGAVLDAGCGHAELGLALAARGTTSSGSTSARPPWPRRRRRRRARAAECDFVADDITAFTGYDGRFDTIVDSTLFHSLPVEGRDGYQRSIVAAAAPGARYYVLAPPRAPSPTTRTPSPTRSTRRSCAPSSPTGPSMRSARRRSTPTRRPGCRSRPRRSTPPAGCRCRRGCCAPTNLPEQRR